jgi:hypothetical protein
MFNMKRFLLFLILSLGASFVAQAINPPNCKYPDDWTGETAPSFSITTKDVPPSPTNVVIVVTAAIDQILGKRIKEPIGGQDCPIAVKNWFIKTPLEEATWKAVGDNGETLNGTATSTDSTLTSTGFKPTKPGKYAFTFTATGTPVNPSGSSVTITSPSIDVVVPKIELSSSKAINSPKEFEYGKTDLFDPRNPTLANEQKAIDSALTIYYKNVRTSQNLIQNFDVDLKILIATGRWAKFEGPASGTLSNASTSEAKFSNPKKGGLYKFNALVDKVTTRTQVWLPKAGPDISSYWQREINYFRNTWGPAYRNKLNSRTSAFILVPFKRLLLTHAIALSDMQSLGGGLDWHNPIEGKMITTPTSPSGGPPLKSGQESRYTIKGYVIDFRKRNNMMYALIGREMTLLEIELRNGPNALGAGSPDSPAAFAAYEAGFDLHKGITLQDVMTNRGFSMQEPGSWTEREWPSDEITNESLRRVGENLLNQLIE